jgi:TolB-like protein
MAQGKPLDVRSVGRELNVRYLAQGEVRRAGEQIAVNVQLLDAGNATQLWSDRPDVEQAQTTEDPVAPVVRLRTLRNAASEAQFRTS